MIDSSRLKAQRPRGKPMVNFVFSRVGVALVVALVVAAAVIAVLVGRHKPDPDPRGNHAAGFREVSEQAGITWRMKFLPNEQGENFKINLYDHGSGVAVGDFNGDGYDDIYLCNELGDNALYHNKHDGTFEEIAHTAGVALGDRICTGATWADIDNSGHPYLFVTSTGGGNVLFKYVGHNRFVDWTKQAHLDRPGKPPLHSQVAVFFDYDGDGYLDLFIGNTAEWTTKHLDPNSKVKYYPGGEGLQSIVDSPIEHNILYHNNGDGTFTDVTEQAGLQGRGWTADVAVFDYDGDGRLDLLVTDMFGMSTLYHNDGKGKFTDVTKQVLGKTSWGGMGAKAFDYNNDGLLDLYIVDMHSDMWMPVTYDRQENQDYIDFFKKYEKQKFRYPGGPEENSPLNRLFKVRKGDNVVFGNTFFKNQGGGKFEEISDEIGLETFWPWGIAAGDFDNDGFEDVFIPSGMGYPFFYWPNYLMMNNAGKDFTDRAEAEGVEPPARGKFQDERIGGRPAARSSRAAAVADFQNRGCLDIIVNNFNDRPYLFRNQFPQKNWFQLRLKGTKSNRDAVGALVHLYTGGEVMTRMVNPAGGYLAQSSKTLHFGLGNRTKIDRVEIEWPRTGRPRQTIEAPPINQRLDVDERAE